MPVDNSFIPRPFGITDARQRVDELVRKQQALDGANRNSSSTIPPGGTLRVEGGVLVPGGQISVTGGGNISTTADGKDRYTGQPIKVSTSLGNRQVIDEWTGNTVLRPGIFIDASNNPRDPANVASLFSRYGDDLNAQSAVTSIENTVEDWQSSLGAAPAGVALTWAAVDRTMSPVAEGRNLRSGSIGVDVDGGSGIKTYARTLVDINDPAIQHVTVSSEARAYGGQLGPAEGAKMTVRVQDYQWNTIERSWIRLDRDGLLQLHSVKASGGTVDITHSGDGVLNLAGSSRVNVNGTFTVNGNPVGGAVTSVAGKTGDVVLSGSDIPAATTSAPGAMTAADKTKLNGLGGQALAPLSPSGWSVTGDVLIEPVGTKQKVTVTVRVARTGANITTTANVFQSVGQVMPSSALSSTAPQTYQPAKIYCNAGMVGGTAFINPSTGGISFATDAAQTLSSTNGYFSIFYIYTI